MAEIINLKHGGGGTVIAVVLLVIVIIAGWYFLIYKKLPAQLANSMPPVNPQDENTFNSILQTIQSDPYFTGSKNFGWVLHNVASRYDSFLSNPQSANPTYANKGKTGALVSVLDSDVYGSLTDEIAKGNLTLATHAKVWDIFNAYNDISAATNPFSTIK